MGTLHYGRIWCDPPDGPITTPGPERGAGFPQARAGPGNRGEGEGSIPPQSWMVSEGVA